MIHPKFLDYSYVFFGTLSSIKDTTGLELTLIEKVHLKNIVLESIERAKLNQSRFDEFDTIFDSKVLFLIEYYGIDLRGKNQYTIFHLRRDSLKLKGYDGFKEHFRRQQEAMHLP